MNERRRTASIWAYFKKCEDRDDKSAACNICGKILSFKSSVSNLKCHLKFKHITVFNKLNLQSRKSSWRRPATPQLSDSSRPGSSQSCNEGDGEIDRKQSNVSCPELQELTPINKKSLSSEDLLVEYASTSEQLVAWGNSKKYKNAQSHATHHATQPQEVMRMLPKPQEVTFVTTDNDRLTTVRQEDECDIIGKNVAAKLRSLLPIQKIFAEKIINDTLYEAQLNNLSRASSLSNPP